MWCGGKIAQARLGALPEARFCLKCQESFEANPRAFQREARERARSAHASTDEVPETQALQIAGDRLVSGDWSASLMQVAAQGSELQALVVAGRWQEARELIQTQSAEAQAALVTLNEDPEEVLSLTGMSEEGKPSYCPAVVNRLPTEVLAQLVDLRDNQYLRYNSNVIRAMTPGTFARAVHETLDPVDQQDLRTKIAWEWLEAVASMEDTEQAAQLLREIDLDVIEDAILDRFDGMHLEKTGASNEVASVSRLTCLIHGLTNGPPGRWIEDPETKGILNRLSEAAPDLIGEVMTRVARRLA